MSSIHELVQVAQSKWVTSVFGWLIALLLANGALVHVLNILGRGKGPWNLFPPLWRVMDVVLLIFNVVVATGLAFRQSWSIYVLYIGMICLQIIPYTVFRSQFVTGPEDNSTLNRLVATEVLLLVVYAGVLIWQGNGGGV